MTEEQNVEEKQEKKMVHPIQSMHWTVRRHRLTPIWRWSVNVDGAVNAGWGLGRRSATRQAEQVLRMWHLQIATIGTMFYV
jgi:hypothetical protein